MSTALDKKTARSDRQITSKNTSADVERNASCSVSRPPQVARPQLQPQCQPKPSANEFPNPAAIQTSAPTNDAEPKQHEPARQAAIVKHALFPSQMATAIGLRDVFDASGYRAFLDQLVRDAGNPSDPLQIMLLQQMAMSHFRIGDLHGLAAKADDPKAVEAFTNAAARLTAEFRRSMVALAGYRQTVGAQPTGEKNSVTSN